MEQRTKKPSNNKYYIRIVSGGLNGAVQGDPCDSSANVLANCVGYANGRFNEIISDPDLKGLYAKFKYQLVCNAENFIERAKRLGLTISNKPTLGGIMVWQKGATLYDYDGAGHVAIVEEVIDSNTIVTSESAYNCYAFKRFKRTNSNGRWDIGSAFTFRGCVVNPSVKVVETKPAEKIKKYIEITSYRNCYDTPKKNKKIMQVPEGSKVYVTKKQGKWLYVPSLNGWICQSDSKIGMCVKDISMKAHKYKTTRDCPARSIPVRGSKINENLKKGDEITGRDLCNGYMYAVGKGWVTHKWCRRK